MPRSPTSRRRPRRPTIVLGVLLLVVVAAVVALRTSGGRGEHDYRLVFDNASQLVKGGTVRIGGIQVGTIRRVTLTRDDLAEVEITVADRYAPLRQGTSATIRLTGIASVAARYVDLSPAPSYRPPLADGARIPLDRTSSVVEIDQVLDALDPPTRGKLKDAVRGLTASIDGRASKANAALGALPEALAALRGVAADVNAQSGDFRRLMVDTGQAMQALGREPDRLTGAISGARRTMDTLAGESGALRTTVAGLPATLGAGSQSLAALRAALPDLRQLTDAADRSSRTLAPFLRQLRPVLERAVPVTADVRQAVDRPGPENDLLDAFEQLPALARTTHRTAPRVRAGLRQATPLLSFARPYTPDFVAWLRSFGSAAATYDANGHYVRAAPVVDAFRLVDDPAGGTLLPVPPGERGTSDALSRGNLKRCPGTAAAAVGNGTMPALDSGPLANVDCDPSELIGGAR